MTTILTILAILFALTVLITIAYEVIPFEYCPMWLEDLHALIWRR